MEATRTRMGFRDNGPSYEDGGILAPLRTGVPTPPANEVLSFVDQFASSAPAQTFRATARTETMGRKGPIETRKAWSFIGRMVKPRLLVRRIENRMVEKAL